LPMPALAQTDATLTPVLVTASRFAADPAFAPVGATVITAAEIRDAGIGNVNEAIRKIGGVFGRRATNGSDDYALDLRGFGATAEQNTVILVDGIRISEDELATALLSSVPIETVERIEIVRGGSSVLYGSGATGGTIQIITKRGAAKGIHGSAVIEAGNRGLRSFRGSIAQGWDGLSADANVSTLRSDNYRANNDLKQDNFSGGLQWANSEGRVGVRVDAARQDYRLAGSLTEAQFKADPRQTNTPDDFGSVDTDRYTIFGQRNFGNLQIAADLSHREKTARGFFGDPLFGDFSTQANSRVTQFSPRLRHLSDIAGMRNEFVAGVDFAKSERNTDSVFAGFASGAGRGSQDSKAIYVRDEIRIDRLRVALGGRHEVIDQDFTDALGFATTAYDRKNDLNAWDLQGTYTVAPGLDVFAKAGRSYRVANIDENGATPLANTPLDPQTSRDLELGAAVGDSQRKLSARVFQHRLKNEIYYNSSVFANVNLDPTRREGVELEASARVLPNLMLRASLTHVRARFTEGDLSGNDVPLVPKNIATLRANWTPLVNHTADIGLQYVDKQRYGNDTANSCSSQIPSYTTLDARYAVRFGAWEVAIAGSNLADRDYFSYAAGACRNGIYSDNGRQVKLSARLDF
jgi:iron complex outermembrane receptor protein